MTEQEKWAILYKYDQATRFVKDSIQGCFNALCTSETKEELFRQYTYMNINLCQLVVTKLKEIEELGSDK